jgi:hypothetical protein
MELVSLGSLCLSLCSHAYYDCFSGIVMYAAYRLIKNYYGDRVAERSGVPLIKHIDEGLNILWEVCPDKVVARAFCVHPLLQSDGDLAKHYTMITDQLYSDTVLYAMEYRNIANQSLSDIVVREGSNCYLKRPIKLSPIREVNCMLVADKVQNRSDFEIYHKGAHARSKELDFYFKTWLNVLGISEEDYIRLVGIGKSINDESNKVRTSTAQPDTTIYM